MPKKQTEWSNAYKKKAYDEVRFVVPKGRGQVIKEWAAQKGMSVSSYVKTLILADMGLPLDLWNKEAKDTTAE